MTSWLYKKPHIFIVFFLNSLCLNDTTIDEEYANLGM